MITEKDKTEEVTTTTPSADATEADATGTGVAIMRELPPNVGYSGYPTAPLSAFEEAGTGAQSGSEYSAVNEFLSQFGGESDKDRKKRERREAAQQIAYGLGDTARALGNLYFTTQYSPSQDIDKTSMSEANQQRLDRLRKEREQNRDRMTQYAFNIAKLKGDDDDRSWKRQKAKEEAELNEKKWNYKVEQDAKEAERLEKAAEQKQQNWEAELDQKQKYYDGILANQQTRNDIYANKGHGGGGGSHGGGGGGSKGKKYPIYIDNKKWEIDYDDINDYNVRQIYIKLPERVRKKYEYDEKYKRINLTKDRMMQILAENANDPNVKRELLKLAGYKPRSGNF